MRGYFGIGIEGVSKPMNLGSLLRTGHAFGASFVFTIGGVVNRRQIENADTSAAMTNLPLHEYAELTEFRLPRCDYVIRIPTRFCVNLAVAGALVMYDRMLSLGRFAERPVRTGGPLGPPLQHVHGEPIWRSKQRRRLAAAQRP
jgi:tRNA G18 (ribose-2'-O)-methylase SpoU